MDSCEKSPGRLAAAESLLLLKNVPFHFHPPLSHWSVKSRTKSNGGMSNLGNTCFVNATVQALIHIQPFMDWLGNEECHRAECTAENCLLCALWGVSVAIQNNKSFHPAVFLAKLKGNFPRLFDGNQQDANEFLISLFTNLDESFVQSQNVTGRRYSPEELCTTPVYRIFGYQLKENGTCRTCGTISPGTSYTSSQLILKLQDSVQESLERFLLPDSAIMFCDTCKNNKLHSRNIQLVSLPNIFIFLLQRFVYHRRFGENMYCKINKAIKLDHEIRVLGTSFKLLCVVNHHGETLLAGHYTAVCRWLHEDVLEWTNFDDERVAPATPTWRDECAESAYLLIYEQCLDKVALPDSKTTVAVAFPSLHEGVTSEEVIDEVCPSTSLVSPIKESGDSLYTPDTLSPSANSKEENAVQKQEDRTVKQLIEILRHQNVKGVHHMKKKELEQNLEDLGGCISNVEDAMTPLSPKVIKQGIPFQRMLQMAICRLSQYFQKEADNGGPLISVFRVRERVCAALGIGKNSVSQYTSKMKRSSPFCTPGKKRPSRKKPKRDVDGITKNAIANLVYEFRRNGEHVKLATLLEKIRERSIDFKGGAETLRKILHDIGFEFQKDDSRRYLVEQPAIVLKKVRFLKSYMEYSDKLKYPFVFTDETWIFEKGVNNLKHWINSDVKSCVHKYTSVGKRYIVLHAGGQNGWVPGAANVFASKSKFGDYHGQMNSENFEKWFSKQLLNNLYEPTVVVIDNASYHSRETVAFVPSKMNVHEAKAYLQNSKVAYPEDATLCELQALARLNPPPKQYVIDDMCKSQGHIILRLPPYHCCYNPIELVWGIWKRKFELFVHELWSKAPDKKRRTAEDVDALVEKAAFRALEEITPKIWAECVRHCDELIRKDYKQYCAEDINNYEQFKFVLSDGSSSDESVSDVDDPEPQFRPETNNNKSNPDIDIDVQSPVAKRCLFSGSKNCHTACLDNSCEELDGVIPVLQGDENVAPNECSGHHCTITPEMKATVSRVFANTSDDHIICYLNHQLRPSDIRTLEGQNLLNDEVINMYFKLIEERGKHKNAMSVHCFPTFFLPRLICGSYSSVKKWTRTRKGSVNIFHMDLIFFPLHLPNHWCLAVVKVKNKVLEYYDSLGGSGQQNLQILWNYLDEEHQTVTGVKLIPSEWKLKSVKDIPQQDGGFDCGAFVCLYAEMLSRGEPLLIDPADMLHYRQIIAFEILTSQLLNEVQAPPQQPLAVVPIVLINAVPAPANVCSKSADSKGFIQPVPKLSKQAISIQCQARPIEVESTPKSTGFHKDIRTNMNGVWLRMSASFHQNSNKFPLERRNRQSLGMAVLFLAAHFVKGEHISRKDLDEVLIEGDKYFTDCAAQLDNEKMNLLSPSDFKNTCTVFGNNLTLEVKVIGSGALNSLSREADIMGVVESSPVIHERSCTKFFIFCASSKSQLSHSAPPTRPPDTCSSHLIL